jgi:gluconolactonase
VLQTITTCAGAAFAGPAASALGQAQKVLPPTTVTIPPRDFGPNAPPTTYFRDPDILVVDPLFEGYVQPNTSIKRLWTGALWAEGPAWSGLGRYLVWSDIPNNRQLRWLEDDDHVSVFRSPSNNSNGNTFDFQGRQLSCEHLARRVVRYEHDGSVTVIADSYNGKRFTSPNDIVPHPDGSYWFTDPPYGAQLYEGQPDASGGAANRTGRLNPRVGQPAEAGRFKRELPNGVYRVDAGGKVTLVAGEEQVPDPNGLAFSPDHRKLYIISTGKGPGDTGPGGKGNMFVFDVTTESTLTNGRLFADFVVDGVRCAPDGVRCDVDGNVWCSSNAGGAVGYNGVTVWTPDARLIGRIRLPEVCGNLCFGGPKRNRLFMAASQSLYAVYVNTQGAAPG